MSVPTSLDGARVLVTGGSGFLGRHVVDRLVDRGAHVVAPRRAEHDLTRAEAAAAAFDAARPDVVIHLAARVGGIGANRAAPADLYLENLLMGTFVIDEARRRGVTQTVVAGTVCSYPRSTPVPFSEDDLWDGYPEETNAPYGIAKRAHLVQAQANRAQYGQRVAYVMPTNLYGPGDHFDPSVSHVIPALIRKCVRAVEASEDEIVVWGSGRATREFLYVTDAAEGIVAAAEHYDSPEPVNLGADEEVSICELAERIAHHTGFGGRLVWDPSMPDGQPRRRVDPSRAAAAFGFAATTALDKGLARTVEWYLAHRAEAERPAPV